MWELIARRAELTPDRLMLVDERDQSITFGAFRDRAERVAAGLHELGIGEGTPVSWQLPSSIDTIVLSAALSRLVVYQDRKDISKEILAELNRRAVGPPRNAAQRPTGTNRQ